MPWTVAGQTNNLYTTWNSPSTSVYIINLPGFAGRLRKYNEFGIRRRISASDSLEERQHPVTRLIEENHPKIGEKLTCGRDDLPGQNQRRSRHPAALHNVIGGEHWGSTGIIPPTIAEYEMTESFYFSRNRLRNVNFSEVYNFADKGSI